MTASNDSRKAVVRRVSRVIRGMPATDGAGVELTRVIEQPVLPHAAHTERWYNR